MASPSGLFSLFDNAVKRFLPTQVSTSPAPGVPEPALTALAAVLVHVARVDGVIVKRERDYLVNVLVDRFGLQPADAGALLEKAQDAEQDPVGIVGVLRPLRREMDREERKRLIRTAWDVARVDGAVHAFEDDAIWRSARLLDLTEPEITALREEALAGR
ncbi:TerB family tellurite resistance protein [Pseudochelatococcus lubricantis]|uniref:tellurite resistance TerB family protein n=1 Tax=Pseudochelatococcus lubricantis TaxID=1538102 RepID=UPI0035E7E7C9